MRVVALPWSLDAYYGAVAALLRTSFGQHVRPQCCARKRWWAVVAGGDGQSLVAAVNVDDDTGVLWDLCVAPAARGRGVATRLLRHVARERERARARGAPPLRLFIDSWDLAPFYRKRGFVDADADDLPPGVDRPARAVACLEAIAAFCQSEKELQRGQRLLAQAKRPLLQRQRETREQLLARLEALRLPAANVRVGEQCYRLKACQRKTKRAVTPRVIRAAVDETDTFPTEPTTVEDLGKWVWARLQAARTVVQPALSITAAKTDLATVLPESAHLPALGAGGTPEEREKAEEAERHALHRLMTEHGEAQRALRALGQENREAKDALRAQSAAAEPGVRAYMEARDVRLQPVRLGDEQFSMRRRQSTRIVAPTKASDIQELIDKALRALLAGEEDHAPPAPDRVLAPEELAACAPRLAAALHAALPRRTQTRVALLRRPGAKKSAENNNHDPVAEGEGQGAAPGRGGGEPPAPAREAAL